MTQKANVSRDDYSEGWDVAATADNDVELLEYTIQAADILDAASRGIDIANLVATHDQVGDAFHIQITLRPWRVEIIMSVPKRAWYSDSQAALARSIRHRFNK